MTLVNFDFCSSIVTVRWSILIDAEWLGLLHVLESCSIRVYSFLIFDSGVIELRISQCSTMRL